MASTLGSESFFHIGPVPHMPGYVDSEITRPGVAGIAFQEVGFRAQPTAVQTVTLCANAAAVGTNLTNYSAMQGSLYTFVNDLGLTWYNIKVVDVSMVHVYPVVSSVPSGTAYVLICRWTLLNTNAS